MPSLRFRLATQADVAVVVDLVESAYRGERSKVGWTTEADLLEGQRTDPASIAAVIAAPDSVLLLAVDEFDDLVGCSAVDRRPGDVCYFGTFAVRPALQNAGTGKLLLAEAERRARDEWASRSVEMTVIGQREDLIAWYVRRGYAPSGEMRPFPYGDERFGLPRREGLYFVVLVKELR